jgi:uncharacterized protein
VNFILHPSSFILLLLLAVGQFEILVTLVNRLHAFRFRGPTMRCVRDLHEVLLVALPLGLAWLLATQGASLLDSGGWSQLPLAWMIYLAICAAGTVGFFVSVARHLLRRRPKSVIERHSMVVDLAARLGYRPLGRGPYRLLAKLPINEIFRVEVCDKSVSLPRLPVAFSGLTVLHLTDLHLNGTIDRPFFEALIDLAIEEAHADLVVFTGDLLDDLRLIDWLPSTLGRLSAPLGCHFILGNHDWYLGAEPVRRRLVELGWHDVAGNVVVRTRDGATLAIGGTERPWMGQHPDFSVAPPDAFRLLLSHTPDNLAWARRQGVDLMLSGHNHGGQVVPPLIGPIYSPSVHGCRYAGGAFEAAPTLLYVSRGISGRHPLRWRCLPELTRFTLVSSATRLAEPVAAAGAGLPFATSDHLTL